MLPPRRPNPNSARMKALRIVAAEDRLTRVALEHLRPQVEQAQRAGLSNKQIGDAILRGALLSMTVTVQED